MSSLHLLQRHTIILSLLLLEPTCVETNNTLDATHVWMIFFSTSAALLGVTEPYSDGVHPFLLLPCLSQSLFRSLLTNTSLTVHQTRPTAKITNKNPAVMPRTTKEARMAKNGTNWHEVEASQRKISLKMAKSCGK